MTAKKDTKKNSKPVAAKKTSKKPVTKTPSAHREPTKTTAPAAAKKTTAPALSSLRGMRDMIPPASASWPKFNHAAEAVADAYGFSFIETPIVEMTSLFVRAVGRGTDVVDKEMYTFEDRDGGKICLRPEATASVVRAYVMHGLQTLPQPVKVWYSGSMFRYDRPQAGRYRQFHQFGCETLGEREPVIDAELIAVAYNILRDLGISSTVRINSIGTPADREQYIVELSGYLRTKRAYLCEDCKKRLTRNTLRVLDCKVEGCRMVLAEAPQIIDWLADESRAFFTRVLEYLDELAIPYELSPTLVRGLDYYTHTVFEFYEDGIEEKAQSALCAGGRYDLLVEQLGGQPTPAAGFGMGIERVIAAMERVVAPVSNAATKPRIFFAQLGEQAKRRALYLLEELRREGIHIDHNLAKSSLKIQLEAANRLGATHTLILGQKEVLDGTVLIRNMESGIQEIVDQKKIKNMLKKIIETSI